MNPSASRQRFQTLRTVGLLALPFVVLGLVAAPQLQPRPAVASLAETPLAPYPFAVKAPWPPLHQIAFYEKRIKLDPTDAVDESVLAELYLQAARLTTDPAWYRLADKMARVSVDHQPFQNDVAQMVVAQVQEARHDFHAALATCDKVKQGQDSVVVEIGCDLGLGLTDAAARAADRLPALQSSLMTWSHVALVREEQGQETAMHQAWHKAFSVEAPGDPYSSSWARTMYGRWFFRHGLYTLADGMYREALRIWPQSPVALEQLAALDVVLGRQQDAEAHLEQVPTSATRLMGQAQIRVLQHDSEGSQDLMARAVTTLRRDPLSAGRGLACLLLERGRPSDLAEALAVMEKDIAHERDWLTLDAAAWACQANQRNEQALALENEALRGGIRSAQLHWRRGEIETALGQSAAAASDYAEALRDNPNFKVAHTAVPFMP